MKKLKRISSSKRLNIKGIRYLQADFQKIAEKMLKEIEVDNPEEILSYLVVRFPTQDEIKRNFYFNLIV